MPDIQNIPTTQYVGPRIIPHLWDPILWDAETQYDALAIVQYEGAGYVARYVPPQGTLPTDTTYWVKWADFNAQLAQVQQTVETFDNRITANAEAVATEASTRETADEALEQSIAQQVAAEADARIAADEALGQSIDAYITVHEPNDTTATDQGAFINGGALTVDESITFVDSTRNSRLMPSVNNFGYDTDVDFCYLVALAGTYLAQANKFAYGNSYVGTAYQGTYENPEPVLPTDHVTDGRMNIDCATFTTLLSHGIPYANSRYAGSSNHGFNMMFDPTSEAVKPYWKFNIEREFPDADASSVGYGRLLTDALAKYMHDSGRMSKCEGTTESLPFGGILFSGNNPDRFMRITHCNMLGGYVFAPTTANSILVESDSGHTNGIITRPFSEGPGLAQYRGAYIPPSYGRHRFGALRTGGYAGYHFMYKERNLNSTPLSWEPLSNLYGARVVTIVPNSSAGVSVTAKISTTADAIAKGFDDKSITATTSAYGATRIVMPWGWKLESLSSTDASATFNICMQIVKSDDEIFTPVRGM